MQTDVPLSRIQSELARARAGEVVVSAHASASIVCKGQLTSKMSAPPAN